MLSALLHIVVTGDYLGFAATGLVEDHPVVIALIELHRALVGVL